MKQYKTKNVVHPLFPDKTKETFGTSQYNKIASLPSIYRIYA